MTVPTYRLSPELFQGRFTSHQQALYARGELALCCDRRGLLDLLKPSIVSGLNHMREICCAVGTNDSPGISIVDAMMPWADVSVSIYGKAVMFSARDPQGGECRDLSASCVLPPTTSAAMVLVYLRAMQSRFPGISVSALRPWSGTEQLITVEAVVWCIDINDMITLVSPS